MNILHKPSTASRIIALIMILIYTSPLFSEDFYLNHEESTLLENYLSQANMAREKSEWERMAALGIESVVAKWEERTGLTGDSFNRAALDEKVKSNYTQWLVDRFFSEKVSPSFTEMKAGLTEAGKNYLYTYNPDGTLARDSEGNLILKKTENLETDYNLWQETVLKSMERDRSSFTDSRGQIYDDMKTYLGLTDDSAADFFAARFTDYEDIYNKQLAAIYNYEKTQFYKFRSYDRFSLRKKTEEQSAQAVTARLIEEAQVRLDKGLKHLSESLNQVMNDPGVTSGIIDPEQWRNQFTIEFNAGMDAWSRAEKELHQQRLQWDMEAKTNLEEGNREWAEAYKALQDSKREWEAQIRAVVYEGELQWSNKNDELNRVITEARAELEQGLKERETSLASQLNTLVDIIASSASVLKSADESLTYLQERIDRGDGDNNALNASKDFWIQTRTAYEGYIASAEEKLLKIYGFVIDESTMNSLTVTLDSGMKDSLLGLPPENNWQGSYLDEYQIKLLKAKLVKEYWDKEYEIAKGVSEYAGNTSSERATEAQTKAVLDEKLALLNAGQEAYNQALEELKNAGANLNPKQQSIAEKYTELQKAQEELDKAKIAYDQAFASWKESEPTAERLQIKRYYDELVKKNGLLNSSEYNSDILAYLLSAEKYSRGMAIHSANQLLYKLVMGSTGTESLTTLKEEMEKAQAWTFNSSMESDQDIQVMQADHLGQLLAKEKDMHKQISAVAFDSDKQLIEIRVKSLTERQIHSISQKYDYRLLELDLLTTESLSSWTGGSEWGANPALSEEETLKWMSERAAGRGLKMKAEATNTILSELITFLTTLEGESDTQTALSSINWETLFNEMNTKYSGGSGDIIWSVLYDKLALDEINEVHKITSLREYYQSYSTSLNTMISEINTNGLIIADSSDLTMDNNIRNFLTGFDLFMVDAEDSLKKDASENYKRDLSSLVFNSIDNESQLIQRKYTLWHQYKYKNPLQMQAEYSKSKALLESSLSEAGLITVTGNSWATEEVKGLYTAYIARSNKNENFEAWCTRIQGDISKNITIMDKDFQESILNHLNSAMEYGFIKEVQAGMTMSSTGLSADTETLNSHLIQISKLNSLAQKTAGRGSVNREALMGLSELKNEMESSELSGELSSFTDNLTNLINDIVIREGAYSFYEKCLQENLNVDFQSGLKTTLKEFMASEFDFISVDGLLLETEKLIEEALIMDNGLKGVYTTAGFTHFTEEEVREIYSEVTLNSSGLQMEGYRIANDPAELKSVKRVYEALAPGAGETQGITEDAGDAWITDTYARGNQTISFYLKNSEILLEQYKNNRNKLRSINNSQVLSLWDVSLLEESLNQFSLLKELKALDFSQELSILENTEAAATEKEDALMQIRSKIDSVDPGNFTGLKDLYYTSVTEGTEAPQLDESVFYDFASFIEGSTAEEQFKDLELSENLINLDEWALSTGNVHAETLLTRIMEILIQGGTTALQVTVNSWKNNRNSAEEKTNWIDNKYSALSGSLKLLDIQADEALSYSLRLKLISYINSLNDGEAPDLTAWYNSLEELNLPAEDFIRDLKNIREISGTPSAAGLNSSELKQWVTDKVYLNTGETLSAIMATSPAFDANTHGSDLLKATLFNTLIKHTDTTEKEALFTWFTGFTGGFSADYAALESLDASSPAMILAFSAKNTEHSTRVFHALSEGGFEAGADILLNTFTTEKEAALWLQRKQSIKNSYIPLLDGSIENFIDKKHQDLTENQKQDLFEYLSGSYYQVQRYTQKGALDFIRRDMKGSLSLYNREILRVQKELSRLLSEKSVSLREKSSRLQVVTAFNNVKERLNSHNYRHYTGSLYIPEPDEATKPLYVDEETPASLDESGVTLSSSETLEKYQNEIFEVTSRFNRTGKILTYAAARYKDKTALISDYRVMINSDYSWLSNKTVPDTFAYNSSREAALTELNSSYRRTRSQFNSYSIAAESLKKKIRSTGEIIYNILVLDDSSKKAEVDRLKGVLDQEKISLAQARTAWEGSISAFEAAEKLYSDKFTLLNEKEAAYKNAQFEYDKAEAVYNYASSAYLGSDLEEEKQEIDPENRLKEAQKNRLRYEVEYNVLTDIYNNSEPVDFIERDDAYKTAYQNYRANYLKEIQLNKINHLIQKAIAEQKMNVSLADRTVEENLNNSLIRGAGYIPWGYGKADGKGDRYLDYCVLEEANGVFSLVYKGSLTGLKEGDVYYNVKNGQFVNVQESRKFFFLGGSVNQLTGGVYNFTQAEAQKAFEDYLTFTRQDSGNMTQSYAVQRRQWADSMQSAKSENFTLKMEEWALAAWYKDYTDAQNGGNDYLNNLKRASDPYLAWLSQIPSMQDINKKLVGRDASLDDLKAYYFNLIKGKGLTAWNNVKNNKDFQFFHQSQRLGTLNMEVEDGKNHFMTTSMQIPLMNTMFQKLDDRKKDFEIARGVALAAAAASTAAAIAALCGLFTAFAAPPLFAAAAVSAAIAADNWDKILKYEESIDRVNSSKQSLENYGGSITKVYGALYNSGHEKLTEKYNEEAALLATLEGSRGGGAVSLETLKNSVSESLKSQNYTDLASFLNLTDEDTKLISGSTAITDSEIYNWLFAGTTAGISTGEFIDKALRTAVERKESANAAMSSRITVLQGVQQGYSDNYSHDNAALSDSLHSLDSETLEKYLTWEAERNKNVKTVTLSDDDPYVVLRNKLSESALQAYYNSAYNDRSHKRRLIETDMAVMKRYDITSSFHNIPAYINKLKETNLSVLTMYKEKLGNIRLEKESHWATLQMDLNKKKETWVQTVDAINRRGSRDWNKAMKKYQRDKQNWLDSFEEAYREQSSKWAINYSQFLSKKASWVEELAVKTSVAGNRFIMGDITASAENAIEEATKETLVQWQEQKTEIAADEDYLTNLVTQDFNRMLETLKEQNSQVNNVNTAANGLLDLSGLSSINVMDLIQDFSSEDRESLKKELLIITALKAEEQIKEAKKALVKRVDSANNSTGNGIINRLSNYGYDYNVSENTFTMEIITDATSFGGVDRDNVRIEGYRDFTVPTEVVNYKSELSSLDLQQGTISSRYIESLIGSAMDEIKALREGMFGPDTVSLNEKEETETLTGTNREMATVEEKALGFIPYEKQEIISTEVSKERKKLRGTFNIHVGYAPELIDQTDPLKAKSASDFQSQIKFQGKGEMNRIMTDFFRYQMLEQRGWREMSKDWSERRIVNDDNAPDILKGWTVRKVLDIGISIAGAVFMGPFGAAAMSLIDDALFSASDIANGADVGEELFDLGKTAAVSFAMAGIGELGISQGISSSLGGGFIGNTTGELANAFVTNQINSASAAFSYNSDSGFGFDENIYLDSAFGKGALTNYASIVAANGASSLLSGSLEGFSKLDASKVKTVADFGGDLARAGTEFAIMGETSVNLLNLSDFGLKNRMTGNDVSMGLFEVRLNKDKGISAGYGSGGIGLNYSRMSQVVAGFDTWKTQQKIRLLDATGKVDYSEEYQGHNSAGTALRTQYSFGGDSEKAQLMDILSGKTKLRVGYIDNKGLSTKKGETKIVDLATLGEKDDLNSRLRAGVVLSHESFRDGVVDSDKKQSDETLKAVDGHVNFAFNVSTEYDLSFIAEDTNLMNDMIAFVSGNMEDYVRENYDSSADYWLLMKNGDILFDGHLNIYKEGETDPNDPNAGLLYTHEQLFYEILEYYMPTDGPVMYDAQRKENLFKAFRGNLEMINSGNKETLAYKYLMNDGFMSKKEAHAVVEEWDSKKEVSMNWAGNKYKIKYPKVNKDLIMHYSVRYVMNEHDILKSEFESRRSEFYNQTLRDLAEEGSTPTVQVKKYDADNNVIVDDEGNPVMDTFILLNNQNSIYHGEGCFKWISKETGREIVITANGEYDLKPETLGTFNFGDYAEHAANDVIPYWMTGSSPDDTKAWNERFFGPDMGMFFKSTGVKIVEGVESFGDDLQYKIDSGIEDFETFVEYSLMNLFRRTQREDLYYYYLFGM